MSIRIEGGGSKENIIKSGTSNELLYNDEEIFLKKDFGLLPPDLSKIHEIILTIGLFEFAVPEDGWILSFESSEFADSYIKIDGIGNIYATPSQRVGTITIEENISKKMLFRDMHCPYPVKKGQVLTATMNSLFPSPTVIINFASCISV